MSFNIVLLEPEIPQNTGNIARTCAVTGSVLHLIRPLGFNISDKHLKRAGMDYWYNMDIKYHDDYGDFINTEKPTSVFFATTKAEKLYSDVFYTDGSYIVLGKESAGIPEEILVKNRESCVRIPMLSQYRSINIASAAAILLFEALRQQDFNGLDRAGRLHKFSW